MFQEFLFCCILKVPKAIKSHGQTRSHLIIQDHSILEADRVQLHLPEVQEVVQLVLEVDQDQGKQQSIDNLGF